MSNVYPFPVATSAALNFATDVDPQAVLCALYCHDVDVVSVSVRLTENHGKLRAALDAVGLRVVAKGGRYEVVK